LELAVLKAAVGQVRQEYAFSERRAGLLMTMAVSSYRYRARRCDQGPRARLVELAREKPRFGVYREAGLSIRRKKRKHCVRIGQPLRSWKAANQEWLLDFVQDAIACGRAIRVLSVVDAYTRE